MSLSDVENTRENTMFSFFSYRQMWQQIGKESRKNINNQLDKRLIELAIKNKLIK